MEIKEIRKILFKFQFAHRTDKERVLQGALWWFDKKVLGLGEFDGAARPSDLRPVSMPFWVRIYDLPFNQQTFAAAKSFRNKIGDFLDWDDFEEGCWGGFMHIRVLLNFKKPLKRGSLINYISSLRGSKIFVMHVDDWDILSGIVMITRIQKRNSK